MIFLDNEVYTPGSKTLATVRDVVEEIRPRLRARDRLIVGIACDQSAVPESGIDDVLERQLGDFERLDLASVAVTQLADSALQAAGEILARTRPVLHRAAAHLSSGEVAVALEALKECIAAWGQAHVGTVQTVALLGLDIEAIATGHGTVPQTLDHIAGQLSQLKECLQQRDYVLLNDIIQYEILPSFDRWEAMIRAVRERATSPDRPVSGP